MLKNKICYLIILHVSTLDKRNFFHQYFVNVLNNLDKTISDYINAGYEARKQINCKKKSLWKKKLSPGMMFL